MLQHTNELNRGSADVSAPTFEKGGSERLHMGKFGSCGVVELWHL